VKPLWTFENWLLLAREKNLSLVEVVLEKEIEETGSKRETIINELEKRLKVMRESLEAGLKREKHTPGGMIKDESKILQKFFADNSSFAGTGAIKAAIYAIAVAQENAGMGRIVALPTGGSSGIVPGVFFSLDEEKKLGDEKLKEGLLIAAGVGMVVGEKLEMAGAAGGCQAECGVAGGMAAAGAMYMLGGKEAEVFQAFALTVKNMLGLVCDPVGGLVEVPCVKRNGFAAVQALLAVDLVRGGLKSVIPPDEVVDALAEIGRLLPSSLKETAKGGLAQTKTGLDISEKNR